MATTDAAKLDVAIANSVIETDESYADLLNTTQLSNDIAIPVPTNLGTVFSDAFNKSKAYYDLFHKDWERAVRAFVDDGSAVDYDDTGIAKENYVRWIVQTLLDYTYMQNPTLEFSATEESHTKFANALSETITAIVNKSNGLGVNLKPHMQKLIMITYLTNFGVLKLKYKPQKGSREEVLALYNKTIEKLQEKTLEVEKIAEFQALIDRLFSELQTREDFGINVVNVSSFNFYVDVDTTMTDLSDCKRTFERELIDENLLKTEYMIFDEAEGKWFFKQDTSVEYTGNALNTARDATQKAEAVKAAIVDTLMPELPDEERDAVAKGKVPCIWVYDRPTRRCYLYIDNRWDTPLWVFEDELQLSRFYPYFVLSFTQHVRGIVGRSEVSYVIPGQDEINETNKQWKLLRNLGFRTFLFNSTAIDKTEIDKVFKQALNNKNELMGIGVKLGDPEANLDDFMKPFLIPAAQAQPLFDNERFDKIVQRNSRLTAAMQASEFRTNTTNMAVETYQQQLQSRTMTFNDPIEELIAQLGWAIAEIVVSLINKQKLSSLISQEKVDQINTMSVEQFNQYFTITVEAGSMEKPNSQNKKQEAMTILQLLGQFGTAAPQTVLGIVTKLLRNVFSRNLVTDKDLETLQQEGAAFMQKGVSTQQQPPAQQMPVQGQ